MKMSEDLFEGIVTLLLVIIVVIVSVMVVIGLKENPSEKNSEQYRKGVVDSFSTFIESCKKHKSVVLVAQKGREVEIRCYLINKI